jgi:hypothetical protein
MVLVVNVNKYSVPGIRISDTRNQGKSGWKNRLPSLVKEG